MSSESKANSVCHKRISAGKIVICLLSVVLICVAYFLFHSLRNTHQLVSCQNRLSTLAEAIHGYHESHDAFPPATGPIIPDDASSIELSEVELVTNSGVSTETNKWSWRVRILPFIGEEELYDKFHFDEPWNSEHNLRIAETMPHFFQCPAEESGTKKINGQAIPVTNYVMATGPKTIGSTDGRIVRFEDILNGDGPRNSLLFVEVAGENRPVWTSPIDITLEELARGVNTDSGMSVGSRHPGKPGGTNICFADCSTRFIESNCCDNNEVVISRNTNGNFPVSSKKCDSIGELFVTLAIYDDNYIPPLP